MSSSNTNTAGYRKLAQTMSTESTKTANLAHFQCGDKSHDTYRHLPNLEARIRHNCDLPKLEITHKDEKGRIVTTVIHRSIVTKAMVTDYHYKAENRYTKAGGKVQKPEQKPKDQALADRRELEEDEWDVIDENDVDDSMDVVGEFSGKKVRTLLDGLQ